MEGRPPDDWADLLWLEQHGPLQLQWTPSLGRAARKAAQEGNLSVLSTLLTRSGFHLCTGAQDGPPHFCTSPACQGGSSCKGSYDVVEFCEDTLQVYRAAAASGQLSVLQWLFGTVHPYTWYVVEDLRQDNLCRNLLAAAAGAGQMSVLEWMHSKVPPALWGASILAAFKSAARAGRMPVVIWLHRHSNPAQWGSTDFSRAAAAAGSVDVLKWLCHECNCQADEDTMAAAASSGSMECMQLLHSLSCPISCQAMYLAMECNRPQCLAWMRSLQPPYDWISHSLVHAVENHALDAIKMARALDPPCPWDDMVVPSAIRHENAEILAWLLEHGAPHSVPEALGEAMPQIFAGLVQPQCTLLLILSSHQVPLCERRMETVRLAKASCTAFVALVRWARRTQPRIHAPLAHGCSAAPQPACHPQQGDLSLLMQFARLPDELLYTIAATAGIYYQKGCRLLDERTNMYDVRARSPSPEF